MGDTSWTEASRDDEVEDGKQDDDGDEAEAEEGSGVRRIEDDFEGGEDDESSANVRKLATQMHEGGFGKYLSFDEVPAEVKPLIGTFSNMVPPYSHRTVLGRLSLSCQLSAIVGCEATFSSKLDMLLHMDSHHGEFIYEHPWELSLPVTKLRMVLPLPSVSLRHVKSVSEVSFTEVLEGEWEDKDLKLTYYTSIWASSSVYASLLCESSPHSCADCKLRFLTDLRLREHLEIHNRNQGKCPVPSCNAELPGDLVSGHIRKVHGTAVEATIGYAHDRKSKVGTKRRLDRYERFNTAEAAIRKQGHREGKKRERYKGFRIVGTNNIKLPTYPPLAEALVLHRNSANFHALPMSRAKASLLEDVFCAPLRGISAALQKQDFPSIPISGIDLSQTPGQQFPTDSNDYLDEGRSTSRD